MDFLAIEHLPDASSGVASLIMSAYLPDALMRVTIHTVFDHRYRFVDRNYLFCTLFILYTFVTTGRQEIMTSISELVSIFYNKFLLLKYDIVLNK